MTKEGKVIGRAVHARRAWRNQVHETVVSSFQCDVSAMLNLMGIAHMVEYTTEVRACAQGAGFKAVLNAVGIMVGYTMQVRACAPLRLGRALRRKELHMCSCLLETPRQRKGLATADQGHMQSSLFSLVTAVRAPHGLVVPGQ